MIRCIVVILAGWSLSTIGFGLPMPLQKPVPSILQPYEARGYEQVSDPVDDSEDYYEILRTIKCKSADGKDSFVDFELMVAEASNQKRFMYLSGNFTEGGVYHTIASMELPKKRSYDGALLNLRNIFSTVRIDLIRGTGQWSQYRKSEKCIPDSQNWCFLRIPTVEHELYHFESCREF